MPLKVTITLTCSGCKKRIKTENVKQHSTRRRQPYYILENMFRLNADGWQNGLIVNCRPDVYDRDDAEDIYCSMKCLLAALPKALLKVRREANKEAKEEEEEYGNDD